MVCLSKQRLFWNHGWVFQGFSSHSFENVRRGCCASTASVTPEGPASSAQPSSPPASSTSVTLWDTDPWTHDTLRGINFLNCWTCPTPLLFFNWVDAAAHYSKTDVCNGNLAVILPLEVLSLSSPSFHPTTLPTKTTPPIAQLQQSVALHYRLDTVKHPWNNSLDHVDSHLWYHIGAKRLVVR